MRVSLSNRQHPMLALFAKAKSDWYMSEEEAQLYDQRPFRSLLVRGYIARHPGRRFRITEKGREAWLNYISTEIFRTPQQAARPLTEWHGLRVIRGKRKTA